MPLLYLPHSLFREGGVAVTVDETGDAIPRVWRITACIKPAVHRGRGDKTVGSRHELLTLFINQLCNGSGIFRYAVVVLAIICNMRGDDAPLGRSMAVAHQRPDSSL